jgi:hypothetical protein
MFRLTVDHTCKEFQESLGGRQFIRRASPPRLRPRGFASGCGSDLPDDIRPSAHVVASAVFLPQHL